MPCRGRGASCGDSTQRAPWSHHSDPYPPGSRGSRTWDGHSSASSRGAQGPACAVTSTVTESSEMAKLSLFPW